VGEHSLLDISSGTWKWSGEVRNKTFSLTLAEHFVPESSRLLITSVWVRMLKSTSSTGKGFLVPSGWGVFNWASHGVWLIIRFASGVTIHDGWTISLHVGDSSSVRAVDWNLLVILSESVSMSVWIGEESSLEHLIVGWLDTWDKVAWSKGGLFDLSKVVLWVSVES